MIILISLLIPVRKQFFFIKKNRISVDYRNYIQHPSERYCNSEKEAVEFIFTGNLEMPNRLMKKLQEDIIEKLFFSDKRYDLGEVGRYRINKKLNLEYPYGY